MARGRKRRSGPRHPCGKPVRPAAASPGHEPPCGALGARQRQFGLTAEQARDARLGSALGRLAFLGMITPEQYRAGERHAQLMSRYRRLAGLPRMHSPSSLALLPRRRAHLTNASAGDQDLLERTCRQVAAALLILKEAGRDAPSRRGRVPAMLVAWISCNETGDLSWPREDLLNLRHGLEALARLWGLDGRGS